MTEGPSTPPTQTPRSSSPPAAPTKRSSFASRSSERCGGCARKLIPCRRCTTKYVLSRPIERQDPFRVEKRQDPSRMQESSSFTRLRSLQNSAAFIHYLWEWDAEIMGAIFAKYERNQNSEQAHSVKELPANEPSLSPFSTPTPVDRNIRNLSPGPSPTPQHLPPSPPQTTTKRPRPLGSPLQLGTSARGKTRPPARRNPTDTAQWVQDFSFANYVRVGSRGQVTADENAALRDSGLTIEGQIEGSDMYIGAYRPES